MKKKIQVKISTLNHDGIRGDLFERLITGDAYRHGKGQPDYIENSLVYEVKQGAGQLEDVLLADKIIFCPVVPCTITKKSAILRTKDFFGQHRGYVLDSKRFIELMDSIKAIRVKSSTRAYEVARELNTAPKKDVWCLQTFFNWTSQTPHGGLLKRIFSVLDREVQDGNAQDLLEWFKERGGV